MGETGIATITLHPSVIAAGWLESDPGFDSARRLLLDIMESKHAAYLLDSSEIHAVAFVVNRLRLTSQTRMAAQQLIGAMLSFVSGLQSGGQLRSIASRPLLTFATSLAIENDVALADALPAALSLNSGSILIIAAPHLALPFEVMQSRIPQFRFELLA